MCRRQRREVGRLAALKAAIESWDATVDACSEATTIEPSRQNLS